MDNSHSIGNIISLKGDGISMENNIAISISINYMNKLTQEDTYTENQKESNYLHNASDRKIETNKAEQQFRIEMLELKEKLEKSSNKESILIDLFNKVVMGLTESQEVASNSELVWLCKQYKAAFELIRVSLGVEKNSLSFILGKMEEFLNVYTEKYKLKELREQTELIFSKNTQPDYRNILEVICTTPKELDTDDLVYELGIEKDILYSMLKKLCKLNILEILSKNEKTYITPTYLGTKCYIKYIEDYYDSIKDDYYTREKVLQRQKYNE